MRHRSSQGVYRYGLLFPLILSTMVPPIFAVQAVRISEKLNIWDLLSTATYGLLGIALSVLGYLVFDLITPFSLGKELVEDKNVAVGIVVAGIIIGISIIIAAAVS